MWYDAAMQKLFLFDVDGTLVGGIKDSTLVRKAAEDRFTQAIRQALGVQVRSEKDFRGYTDYLILATMLADEGWENERIQTVMPRLLEELDAVHASLFRPDSIHVLPGVEALLKALTDRGQQLGLVTGNLEPVAHRKLEAVGIWHYFSVGGFGNDMHLARSDLVLIAVKRAGFEHRLDNVFVIGDTARDIEAAQEAGVANSVGVVNGYRDPQELADAGAAIVLDDVVDTQRVLQAFGL